MDSSTEISVKQTTGWFEWVKKYLPTLLLIGSGIYFLTTFFNTGKSDHTEIINIKSQLDQLEKEKASTDAIRALQDQVNRQYSTAKDDRDKENAAIEQVADWMHEQIGYQKAIDEKSKK